MIAVLDVTAVERFLDDHGLGVGPVMAERIGAGQSNLTFLLRRADERFVLRRPPPPPLPPSAHDVVREARLKRALRPAGVRVPEVLAICEDASVTGAPFYVMPFVEGTILGAFVPHALAHVEERRRAGEEIVDALVELHAVDRRAAGLESFGRPTGYLERQVRRFSQIWEQVATRELPLVHELARWLDANRPESGEATVVHGDYRFGNVLLAADAPARLVAILDWELATIGDPLADVGYLLATYSDAESPRTVMELTAATREPGFPTRVELAARYAEKTGRDVSGLAWYETLALWKSAVFCEAMLQRYRRGERSDAFAASLEEGVPELLEVAAETSRAATRTARLG